MVSISKIETILLENKYHVVDCYFAKLLIVCWFYIQLNYKINLQIQFPIKSAENYPVLKKSLILPL